MTSHTTNTYSRLSNTRQLSWTRSNSATLSENDSEAIEQRLFSAINNGDRTALQELLSPHLTKREKPRGMQPDGITRSVSESDSDASSLHSNYSLNSDSDSLDAVLQLLLTTTYPNTDGFYSHDAEVLPDAMELLGPSLEHLNAIQIACILGDEDSALDILDFVSSSTEEIGARKVLCEFMGRVWGDGNTVLHLASFLGMSELVKRLLELGANPNKKNGRLYKPVDCADTDETRIVFSTVDEAPKSASPTFWTQDSESAKESNQLFHQPIPIMVDSACFKPTGSLRHGPCPYSKKLLPVSDSTLKNQIHGRSKHNTRLIFQRNIELKTSLVLFISINMWLSICWEKSPLQSRNDSFRCMPIW
ncbi:hypothetical protein BJ741DRAFT_42600 [Chytriomyces cf. hyalinus JEL632]|nr:hypothetical protein BJ741DRAFT_42600 [Chytriomyces cf. hyalinus JEL632]